MDIIEYKNKVVHNAKVLAEFIDQSKEKSFDFCKFATAASSPGELPLNVIMNKPYDLICAAASGSLMYLAKHGADAVYHDGTEFIDVELKHCEINENNLFRSRLDTLYLSQTKEKAYNKNTRQAVRSVGARYHLHSDENRQLKKMLTFLTVAETSQDYRILDVYGIVGDQVMSYLNKSNKSIRHIKLSYFLNEGFQVDSPFQPYGYLRWEDEVRKTAPLLD